MSLPTLDEIRRDFHEMEDWDERFEYLIELGDKLPTFPAEHKIDRNIVQGCQSQVWLIVQRAADDASAFSILADSDAASVRGLIAILLAAYAGKSASEAAAYPIEKLFDELNLKKALSPNRTNGLFSMVRRVRDLAKASAA
jgi:cysteine desulfuration protein SufE